MEKVLRSLPTTIRVISGESSRFFASVQSRIDAVVEANAVERKPVQWAAEIVLHRDRMWRQQGGRSAPGASKVAENLVANLNFKGLSGAMAAGSFSENLQHPLLIIASRSTTDWSNMQSCAAWFSSTPMSGTR